MHQKTAMRTVYINGRFLTQKVTGVQRYCREILLALDQLLSEESSANNLQWILVCPKNTESVTLKSIEIREIGRLKGHAWEQFSLAASMRKDFLINFACSGPLFHRRQIITVHDASIFRVPDAFNARYRAWYKIMTPMILRRNSNVFCVSQFAAAECERFYHASPSQQIVTTEGWQHLDRITAVPRNDVHDLVGGDRYFLAVSSPTPNKNFALIVKAIEELKDTTIRIAIAGNLDEGVFSNLPVHHAQVKKLGYVSDAALKGLYQNADAFIFPSRYEGFGIPPLEAMSMGCPVLASAIPSVQEVCADAVLYFSPNDAASLAREMERVNSSPELRGQLRTRGLERASRFSWREGARRIKSHVESWVR